MRARPKVRRERPCRRRCGISDHHRPLCRSSRRKYRPISMIGLACSSRRCRELSNPIIMLLTAKGGDAAAADEEPQTPPPLAPRPSGSSSPHTPPPPPTPEQPPPAPTRTARVIDFMHAHTHTLSLSLGSLFSLTYLSNTGTHRVSHVHHPVNGRAAPEKPQARKPPAAPEKNPRQNAPEKNPHIGENQTVVGAWFS